jgi:hypothetical protein
MTFTCKTTHHLGVQKGIVKLWIGGKELAPQIACICDVFEDGDVDGIGVVVRKRKGPNVCHDQIGLR